MAGSTTSPARMGTGLSTTSSRARGSTGMRGATQSKGLSSASRPSTALLTMPACPSSPITSTLASVSSRPTDQTTSGRGIQDSSGAWGGGEGRGEGGGGGREEEGGEGRREMGRRGR